MALVNLVSGLILNHSDEPPAPCNVGVQDAAIRRVCEYIQTHCEENPSLGDLARIACLSPYHFQRVFLKGRGVSPHDYLLRLKIIRACELLRKGSPISDVALQTGFVDQSHFSRHFKRIIGVPPGRFLKLNTIGHGI